MKKKVITLLLSLVLVSGSPGSIRGLAAETGQQRAEPVSEAETLEQEDDPVREEETARESDPETTDADAQKDNPVQDREEEPAENGKAVEQSPETEGPSVEEEKAPGPEEEEADISEEAAAEVMETEEAGISDESNDARADSADSGSCGEDAVWTLADTGTLTISGSGTMDDFSGSASPWFAQRAKIRKVIVEDGITDVGDYAFYSLDQLTEVSLSDSVTGIGQGVFDGCGCLTGITIPESVTSIGKAAFWKCGSLKSVTIPEGVTAIAWGTFSGCSSLTGVTIPDSVTEIGESAFDGCSSLKSIKIPNGVASIKKSTFYKCSSLKSITIPDNAAVIEARAFEGCSSLTSVTLPRWLMSIRDRAFWNCGSLESITVPAGVNEIGEDAFPRNSERPIMIIVNSPYAIKYCKANNYEYFDPAAPSITRLSGQNGSDIWVKIEKRDDVAGYHIKYADNSKMTNAKEIFLNGKDNSSKAVSGLTNGKTYYVQAQIYKKTRTAAYWSKWCSVQSVKVEQTPYPTNISKLSTYIGSHIKVDWPRTAGASGYHIMYADNSSMTGAKEVMVKGNSTFTKTLTGLKNGKTYYIKIQTYRTVSGKTFWSSWSQAKSIRVDQIPYGSSINKLTNPSSRSMKIIWDKAPSAAGYHIQYAADSSMKGAKDITIGNKETLSKTVTGLTKGKTYYVRIQTFRKVSGKTYWSSWSKAKKLTITK